MVLTVPIDSRLNELARKWIRLNDRTLQEDAVMVFDHFKNDWSIAVLKKALKDPAYVIKLTKPPKRYYPVRAKAYETLLKWGIDVSKPIIEQPESEPVDKQDPEYP